MFDETVTRRFWSKVDKNGPLQPHMQTPCWIWTGSKKSGGYGQLGMKTGKPMTAHRLSYMMEHGEIASDLLVCHHCDNPSCVRPEHLFLGTHKDNSEDSVKKGRSRRLTPEEREESKARAITLRKEYYQENRERRLEWQKKYREENQERERERKRAWYEQNLARVRQKHREYQRTRRTTSPKPAFKSVRVPTDLYEEIEGLCANGDTLTDIVESLIREGMRLARSRVKRQQPEEV